MNYCLECGVSGNVLTSLKKYNRRPDKLKFSMSTWHKGKCDHCGRTEDSDGEPMMVTEARDFFSPDMSLVKL